jgi:rhodanese-related sulfurtransferase
VEVQISAILATVAFAGSGSRLLRRSGLFAGPRQYLSDHLAWGDKLFSCPHCLCFWLALPCAALLAATWFNFAAMVLLGWRGGYYFNRLLDNLSLPGLRRGGARACHVCGKPYNRGFIQRLGNDFCSYRCWFDYLKEQRRSTRPVFDANGNFIPQEVYPMSYKTINPVQAKKLLDSGQGYAYIDVRSTPEYESGHPAGAFNVPILHRQGASMVPNPDFIKVMEAHFAHDAKLLIGCQIGARSARAAQALIAAGFTDVANVMGGYGGARNQVGEVVERGWLELGYPVEYGSEEGKGYTSLAPRTGTQIP